MAEQISIQAEVMAVYHCAMERCNIPAVREVIIRNPGDVPLENAVLQIESNASAVEPFRKILPYIPPHREIAAGGISLAFCGSALTAPGERGELSLQFTLRSGEGKILAQDSRSVSLLPPDQWWGIDRFPELLAAFSLPDRAEIASIVKRASVLLEIWTKNASLDGYRSGIPCRVRLQAAGVYAAIQERQLSYQPMPASLAEGEQELRLCETVLEQGQGSSLELSLLYAACLEALGLNPLLILKKDHCIAGVWLEDASFSWAALDDATLLVPMLPGGEGQGKIAPVECTAFAAGRSIQFEGAEHLAALECTGGEPVQWIIDVRRARLNGILPLPGQKDEPKGQGSPSGVERGECVPQRRILWERGLLDLGLSNPLLNLQPAKGVVPILVPSLWELEQELFRGEAFSIQPRLLEWRPMQRGYDMESFHLPGSHDELVRNAFDSRRLPSALGEEELAQAAAGLFRRAKASWEEQGTADLFLAMGLLRWFENRGSQQPRYAPVALLPVELIRQGGSSFSLRRRGEGVQVNGALFEMLKRDFGLSIGETGLELHSLFDALRRETAGQERWAVLEGAVLGSFPLSRFIFWEDLRQISGRLDVSPVVRSLADGKPVPQFGEEPAAGERPVFPLPLDADQVSAVQAAERGESFLLQAPPGTGKTQTAAAIIANALVCGKTVLFAAERPSALDKLEQRLGQVGLGRFCRNLLTGPARGEGRTVSQMEQAGLNPTHIRQEEQALSPEQELERYSGLLHKRQFCGLSLYEVIGRYEANSNAGEAVVFTMEQAANIGEGMLERQEQMVQRLIAAASGVDHPYHHPLRWVNGSQYTLQLRGQIQEVLEEFCLAGQSVMEARRGIAAVLERGFRDLEEDWQWFAQAACALSLWGDIPTPWAGIGHLSSLLSAVRRLAVHGKRARQIKSELMEQWDPAFLSQDGLALEADWQEASSKWMLSRLWEKRKLSRRLHSFSRKNVDPESFSASLAKLISYQEEQIGELAAREECGEMADGIYQGDDTDWDKLLRQADAAERSERILEELPGGQELRMRFAASAEAVRTARWFLTAWERFRTAAERLDGLLELQRPEREDWMAQQLARCSEIREGIDGLREWMVWKGVCKEAVHIGLGPVIAAYEGGMFHKEAVPCYRKAVYSALAGYIMKEEEMGEFSGGELGERLEQLRRCEKQRMAKDLLRLQTLEWSGEGCCCVLATPLSAVQQLASDRDFDLVLLDGASQIPVSRAAGVLARGKSVVLMGDPNRGGGFSPISGAGEGAGESAFAEFQSLGMPVLALSWHYRSCHENLFAFSNREFYGNRLYTLPAVCFRESRIQMRHLQGIFDRTRQNLVEGETVISELIRRLRDPKLRRESVGVVALTEGQRDLTEMLFARICDNEQEMKSWAYDRAEPVFFKSLEDVLEDERDVILLSASFGRDREGKPPRGFGALDREDGWKGLNSAVALARSRIEVFSSILPEEIDLSRVSSRGAAALKGFLSYAQTGVLRDRAETLFPPEEDKLADSICRTLHKAGFYTQRKAGNSQYTVEIGVIDPRDRGEYLAGILLDSPGMNSDWTWEIRREEALQGMGWTLFRVWSIDWLENSKGETEKLLAGLDRLKRKSVPSEPEGQEAHSQPVPEKSGVRLEIPVYCGAELPPLQLTLEEYLSPKHEEEILERIHTAVEIEAPVSEALLTKRVLESCGILRGSGKVRTRNNALYRKLGLSVTQQEGGRILWRAGQIPDDYTGFRRTGEGLHKREAKDVPQQEAANGVCAVLEGTEGMDKAELLKETGKMLGYSRLGVSVLAAMERGVEYAQRQGRIQVDKADFVQLKK